MLSKRERGQLPVPFILITLWLAFMLVAFLQTYGWALTAPEEMAPVATGVDEHSGFMDEWKSTSSMISKFSVRPMAKLMNLADNFDSPELTEWAENGGAHRERIWQDTDINIRLNLTLFSF